ncbi:NUDIX domain-containing protein [Kribbella orskensis]|uniref:NUDIX domain-containing protein n=1 Tax=Kribbella orskensis TaxID=2512216 RepID=A0ABY2BCP0_9ACTN|nr:NUDIX domain-containing protein [Kribbella sp. VKM Ac-2500]TCO13624.1 NUDIX domain-containing protein [Kribbella orskensis]
MKLLLLDQDDRLLLIHAKDPLTQAECWYPVGGGIEPGETLQEAAAREAHEETGLVDLPPGLPVWRRDHTYEYDGRAIEVHEKWLMHTVDRFDPVPAQLTETEARTILGFRWWRAQELAEVTETIFPPRLGYLLMDLLTDGAPAEPADISEPKSTSHPHFPASR